MAWSPLAKWVWRETPVDALVLGPPQHDGNDPEDIARDVAHRLIVQVHAAGAYRLQWWMLWIALGLSFLGSGIHQGIGIGNPLGGVLGFVIGTGLILFAAPKLTARAASQEERDQVAGVIRRSFLRDVPSGTPPDLEDVWRHDWLSSESRPVGAEITRYDARTEEATRRAAGWLQAAGGLGLGVASLFTLPGLWFVVILILMFLKFSHDRQPLRLRARAFEDEAMDEGAIYVAAGGKAWAESVERARRFQMEHAAKDPSPAFTLGQATGVLAMRGDPFAPSPGLPVARSLFDLNHHELVLGGIGSGKTSGVLRPTALQASSWDGIGMAVMDGKGALPGELAGLPEMQLIRPENSVLSLVGEDPHEFMNTLVDTLGHAVKDEAFFVNMAADLGRQAAVLCHAAGGHYWSALNVYRVAGSQAFRNEVIHAIPEEAVSVSLQQAVEFFTETWPEMEEKTRSNVLSTLRSWYAALTAHPDLLRWAQATPRDDTVNLMSPLFGGRIGLHIPAYRYGPAAATVTALIKARLYGWLRLRAEIGIPDGETPVLLIVDEAQEVLTRDDATMLAIGRSLGLAVVAATQTVEGVQERLGESAAKWLNTFGSVICLSGQSPATFEFAAMKASAVWGAGIGVRPAVRASVATGYTAAAKSQPFMQDVPIEPEGGKGVIGRLLSALAPVDLHQERPSVNDAAPRPLIHAAELGDLLAVPNTALCILKRARVPRRDIVQLEPVYEIAAAETREPEAPRLADAAE